ncbi:uncharacterized protein DUF1992 [Shimia isoporae]|uniref:Uncharacterized protein DUF1992 n=1 Tax=Shimia isoporae TaxID=647720 RepID=A0A4R1N4D7_9RHOB|nr:DnaJ family domain-containing protein [Shimia isoporae]TCL00623.1 uncharacterized protein DUF1992 [Shimia isoporae]
MAHVMNAAIEMALEQASRTDAFQNLPGAGQPLEFLSRPSDAVIDRIMKENQAKPLAVGLKQQLTQASAQLQNMSDARERKEQMRLIADLQTRLGLELEAMQKYG